LIVNATLQAGQGQTRPGAQSHVTAGVARLGTAGLGPARQGTAGEAWLGTARRGMAGLGKAGNTRRDGHHYKRPPFSTMKTKPNETASLEELLGKIAQKHGGTLTPEQVLKAAAPKSSPLHQHFQWDDTEAARQYRLMQAGQLIRRVRITYAPSEGREFRVRAFVNVTPEACEDESPRGHYVSFETAIGIPNYREQLLANARRDAETFKQKYATLEEVLPIIQAIDAGLAR
jgi:hypothetical protein